MEGSLRGDEITPAGSEPSDVDSAYEGDVYVMYPKLSIKQPVNISPSQSETTSITSSIAAHRYENGRRYAGYKDGEYWAPNDEDQNDQLDIAHHIWNLLLDDKLHLAPIDKDTCHEVLDLGTGTGIWAMDFADEHPAASVVGTDLTPIQPHWTPPNCHFEIDDCSQPWTFPENHFDFIHIRCLYGSISDWPELYARIWKHLKPGGWFEQVEYSVDWRTDDDSIPAGHIFREASANYIAAGEKMGRTFRIWEMQKELIDAAGFVRTEESKFKMPLGPWAADRKLKEIGRWHLLEAYQGIEGWTMALYTRVLGWSYEEVQVFLAKVREGFKNRKIHSYTSGSIVYGQKPLQATTA